MVVTAATAQLRQVYLDNNATNAVQKISFYSPSQGFVGFQNWIGFTTDSGHSFTQRPITISNVNYNGYSVNLTFGFDILGVKGFDQNTLIVYGDYGLVPAILYSVDGGSTFKLVFQSQYNPTQFGTGITDMVFPQNDNIGFAVDADRILRTSDKGLTWNVAATYPGSFFDYLEAVDDNHVYAISTGRHTNKVVATQNSGSSWQQLVLPAGSLDHAFFVSANNGYVNIADNAGGGSTYFTSDGGNSWSQKNNAAATPFACLKMKFTNDSTGYAIVGFEVYKTSDSAKVWESLPRDNNFSYLGYYLNDLQCDASSARLWTGGGHGFLELTTNGGGTPFPKAFLRIDTANLSTTGLVHLTNYSRPGYAYQWLRNDTLLSTAANTSYTHAAYSLKDTITLIVSNGLNSDTAIAFMSFFPPVALTSFLPISAAAGTLVTIKGAHFTGATSVFFGGTPAAAFTVVNDTVITATVGTGSSGNVTVGTATGAASLAGFLFFPAPVISSFTPQSAIAGTTITITGSYFTGATAVYFGSTSASFTVVNDNQITATLSSGSTGDVKVTTPGGTATLSGFTELPSIAGFAPASASNGAQVTITGTGFTGVTAVSFGGIAAKSYTVNSSTSISAVVGAGASGNVVIATAAGSSSLPGFTYYLAPVVASFSPTSGPAGTQVTISGSNFGPSPVENTVYFGTVKAAVTAASPTSLTVTVPAAAAYSSLSVTAHGLTVFSEQPFLLTFPNGGSISTRSFAPAASFGFTLSSPFLLPGSVVGDVDGDGKPDVVGFEQGTTGISVARNTSTAGALSYSIASGLTPGVDFGQLVLADMDGDGAPDLVIFSAGSIFICRNLSSPGNIVFGPAARIDVPAYTAAFFVIDADGDGRPDLLFTHNYDGGASISLSHSSPGSFTFDPAVPLNLSFSGSVAIADLDGDGKADILCNNAQSGSLMVLRNASTIGSASFTIGPTIAAEYHYNFVLSDMDGDGKLDIGYVDDIKNTLYALRNTSPAGGISFATASTFPAGLQPVTISAADMDGDGMPDLVVNNNEDSSVSVFKNLSHAGTIMFSAPFDFKSARYPYVLASVDMDGDGKPDILTAQSSGPTFEVLRNTVSPEPFIISFTPSFGIAGTTVTITGTNFTGIDSVYFGGVPAASFTVNSPTTITAVVGAAGSGDVTVVSSFGRSSQKTFVFGTHPVISSVTPNSGPVGATVTITGSNFSAVATDNIVRFGTIRASVTSASTSSLTVVIPAGVSYEPISVTTGRQTAWSSQPFNSTFAGPGGAFTANTFAPRQDLPGGGAGIVADLDDDGQPDLIYALGNNIVYRRNTSARGAIRFTDQAIISGPAASRFAMGDLDGDGKPDLLASNNDGYTVSVYRNLSMPGSVAFATHVDYSLTADVGIFTDALITDVDGDGRPDIVTVNYGSGTMTVFRNLTTNGIFAFDTPIDYPLSGYATAVTSADFDGDGKIDIAVSVNASVGQATIYRNTSTPGRISFDNRLEVTTGDAWPESIRAGDFDGDGKPDLAVANINSSNLTILHNTSSPGALSFGPPVDYLTGDGPGCVAAGDLNGDGKPDVFTANLYQAQLYISDKATSVFANNSTPGNLALMSKFDYEIVPSSSQGAPVTCSSADLDGDGRLDIVIFGGVTGLSFLRNKAGDPPAGIISISPVAAYTGQTITIRGVGLNDATSVTLGSVPAQSYTVVDDSTIKAVVANGSTGQVVVRLGPAVSVSIPGFHYLSLPSATCLNDSTFCSGGTTTLQSSVPYDNQWYRNDTLLVGDTSEILTVRTSGVYSVAGTFGGVTTPRSGGITITVIPTPDPPTITADTAGLVSSDSLGNQWYLGVNAIPGATQQRYKPSAAGEYSVKVTVDGCTSTISSSYDYRPPVTPPPSGNDSIYYSPNPMGNFLTLKFNPAFVSDVSIELYELNGNAVLRQNNVTNGERIDVSSLMPGIYVIRIRANYGQITIVNKLFKQ
ncbi:MAG TPA: FG-GAP-like repeat-containing protein [Puia sp.]|nr:FG-GAP-like repeat-containing protein [Puia sp.]